jgi:hypothetical protein
MGQLPGRPTARKYEGPVKWLTQGPRSMSRFTRVAVVEAWILAGNWVYPTVPEVACSGPKGRVDPIFGSE